MKCVRDGCGAIGALPLRRQRFEAMEDERQFLDHRAPISLQLLAFTAGALPDPLARAPDRRTHGARGGDGKPRALTLDQATHCAVCRITMQELSLAADLARSCGGSGGKLLLQAPEVVCEQLAVSGLLGHTEQRVGAARRLCDEQMREFAPKLRKALSSLERAAAPHNLTASFCVGRCPKPLSPVGTMAGWPGVVQELLDADDVPTHKSLLPGGRAEAMLEDGWGAASALLQLCAARSDVVAIRMLCALGVCEDDLWTPANHTMLSKALIGSTPAALFPRGFQSYERKDARRELRRQLQNRMRVHWAGGGDSASGVSALHIASYLLDTEIVRTLLHAQPSAASAAIVAKAKDGSGRTPLHYASAGSERLRGLVYLFTPQPFATWLQHHTPSKMEFAPPHTRAALSAELREPLLATVGQLLRRGADPLAADERGTTPLHHAAQAGEDEAVSALACAAAEQASSVDEVDDWVGATDKEGRDAVAWALAADQPRTAELLGSLGAADAPRSEGASGGDGGDGGEASADPAAGSAGTVGGAEEVRGGAARSAMRVGADGAVSDPARPDGGGGESLCDLPVVEGTLSTADFYTRHVLKGRPLLLRGADSEFAPPHASVKGIRRDYAALDTSRDFIKLFGEAVWKPQYLLRGNATALGPYMARAAEGLEPRPIAFNRPIDDVSFDRLRALVRWPAAFAHPRLFPGEGGEARASGEGGKGSKGKGGDGAGLDFFVGPEGSGIPMHHHSAVWNLLHHGKKLWAVRPPSESAFAPAQEHPLDSSWLREYRRREAGDGPAEAGERSWFCVQQPGDAIFLPAHWAHATLNLEPGMSVGAFLHDPTALQLHMQLLHAPRGIGSLQGAASMHADWYEQVARAFPTPGSA